MPARTDTQRSRPPPKRNALDDYYPDGEEFGDPFASPEPEAQRPKDKQPEGLGIDEEVSVQKRVREPRVKLDESRSVPARPACPPPEAGD